jgi:hypothetical protein
MIQEDLPFFDSYCKYCGVGVDEHNKWSKNVCYPCRREGQKAWDKSLEGRYSKYKRNTKYKSKVEDDNTKRVFDITFDEFVIRVKSPCVYCGREAKENDYNGLDRVYNDIGYTLDNVVSCCSDCNYCKQEFGFQHFIDLCKRVAEYKSKDKKIKSKPLLNTFSRWIKVYLKDSEVGEISKENFEDPVW